MGYQSVNPLVDPAVIRKTTRGLINDIRAFERMLEQDLFERTTGRLGAEQEMFLVDEQRQPSPVAMELLRRNRDEHVTAEMMQFNLELNLDPVDLQGDCLSAMQHQITFLMSHVSRIASGLRTQAVLTGMLPTAHLLDVGPANLTPKPRYFALDQAIATARGGPAGLLIRGVDELYLRYDEYQLEGATSSFQLHLQVNPEDFAHIYNIAQVLAGPVLGVSVNSPMLFGKRLWRETRIALFQQAMDSRHLSPYLREMSPRVHFGNRWVQESVAEIFREDALRFLPLLECTDGEDALGVLEQGSIPRLNYLQTHNSTVYRWNRPCYGIKDGQPHLRIENRMLPSGPTIVDQMANAALWVGMVRGLADRCEDVASRIDFDDVRGNFVAAARLGLASTMNWFDGRRVTLERLLQEELLPIAEEGLRTLRINERDVQRYLGIISARIETRQTGAQWQLDSYNKAPASYNRSRRLGMMVSAMIEHQKSGEPVHTWPLAVKGYHQTHRDWHHYRVEQFMCTDLYTVSEDECLELAIAIMDWRRIRSVFVENSRHELVGLVTQRRILHHLSMVKNGDGQDVTIRDVMNAELVAIKPDESVYDAVVLMNERGFGQLPVQVDGCLVGVVALRDLIHVHDFIDGVEAETVDRKTPVARVRELPQDAQAHLTRVTELMAS